VFTTDIIVCSVCEGGDLELPIDGVGTPAARIGTWETVRQDGGALATVQCSDRYNGNLITAIFVV
jgi:hypothetical protein